MFLSPGQPIVVTMANEAVSTRPDGLDGLEYEQAREELVATVQRLEAGGLSLEESLALWERGEALAAHCQAKLDGARARLDTAVAARDAAARGDEL
jgi:exodeoxyribonuclease VII small subunit